MKKWLIAAIFSFLIYDEKNWQKKARKFFPDMQVLDEWETFTDYYAVVKLRNDQFVAVSRGTDGTTIIKKILAWI